MFLTANQAPMCLEQSNRTQFQKKDSHSRNLRVTMMIINKQLSNIVFTENDDDDSDDL
jgi:hypothetical protein